MREVRAWQWEGRHGKPPLGRVALGCACLCPEMALNGSFSKRLAGGEPFWGAGQVLRRVVVGTNAIETLLLTWDCDEEKGERVFASDARGYTCLDWTFPYGAGQRHVTVGVSRIHFVRKERGARPAERRRHIGQEYSVPNPFLPSSTPQLLPSRERFRWGCVVRLRLPGPMDNRCPSPCPYPS